VGVKTKYNTVFPDSPRQTKKPINFQLKKKKKKKPPRKREGPKKAEKKKHQGKPPIFSNRGYTTKPPN